MSRVRVIQNNFRAGVLSPTLKGLAGSEFYKSGLEVGRNITVNTLGGISRRPGTKFLQNYGDRIHVRIFPFTFNRDQKYVIVVSLETISEVVTGRIDIYRDDVLVAPDIAIPYETVSQVEELDFAQSADAMIFTQGDFAPYYLRRLGSDSIWDFVQVPIVNPPQYNDQAEDMWTDTLGWPQHCTFHQGRLWFAGSKSFPQNVWASQTQDFFNFAVGTGLDSESIQEALDTDFINPIVNIFSARQLQVFTRGSEFINSADGAITPTSSSWDRQSDYGSEYNVPPVSVDGSTLYVDSTGRTIRKFTYADERGGYDSPSISAAAEHLIKTPKRMGVLRGGADEPSNFTYVVNEDGTIALLNLSKAHELLAWTEWITQGSFEDVITIDRDVYILVRRFVNSSGEYVTYNSETVTYNGEPVWYGNEPGVVASHWMLERLSKEMLVDSGSIDDSITETSTEDLTKDEYNFFGVYHDSDGTGKVVIVKNGNVVFRTSTLRFNPLAPFIDSEGMKYTAGNVLSYNDDVRELYFDKEYDLLWYMYELITVVTIESGKNYIGALTHLLGSEVVANLDGNIYPPQPVRNGADETTVENEYPDGAEWHHQTDVYEIKRYTIDGAEVRADVIYDGVLYSNLQYTQYGYLLSGVDGLPGSVYFELGVAEDSDITPQEYVYDSSGTLEIPFGIFEIEVCACAAGGSGASVPTSYNHAGGGYRGEVFKGTIAVPEHSTIGITIGTGGAHVKQNYGIAGGDTIIHTKTLSGGAGGINYYKGQGAPYVTPCGNTYFDGTENGGYGGQAGLFGNGGHAGPLPAGPIDGGIGAGGGGVRSGQFVSDVYSGKGGDGKAIITFNEASIIYSHRVRKVQLVEVTVTEGVIVFPNEKFNIGQAGLFFPVVAKTMPIDVNAGAGSLVNEPKRIVSVTSRYENTQSVIVNGIELPERHFGEEVLDSPPVLLSGTEKNRHLGYNRETSVTISQNEPMPFTLLSIDIEVNF